jgi:leucyl aminopeptidase
MGDVISLTLVEREGVQADRWIVGCFEGEAPPGEAPAQEAGRLAQRLAARLGWKGREEQQAQGELGAEGAIVALYGLGARHDWTYQKLCRWLGRALEDARLAGAQRPAVVLPLHDQTTDGAGERVLRAIALAPYRFDRYQSDGDKGSRLASVFVVPPAGSGGAYREALPPALVIGGAVAYARDLANAPANEALPSWMEARAFELAQERGMEIVVYGKDELRAHGMGGLLAVGAGSEEQPRMVRLSWGDRGPRIALVGKGVTFDSGGISIKPAASMEEMKYDKCGVCAVLGVVRAVVDLNLPIRLQAYLPLAENMLSGGSYRPGDIVRCYNGKTVEITNTDAEGRLILADALAWAAEEKPDALVELSTLTGHCVIALGHQAAGLFSPDDAMAGELLDAAQASGERLWRLPLYPEFLEEMKGAQADLRNSAGRPGGASLAAAFLSQFVGEVRRWAHIDIAGVANVKAETPSFAHGATGYGVALAIQWLRSVS